MLSFKELYASVRDKWEFKAESHKMDLALAFEKFMKKRGWTPADLARELNVSRSYISQVMRGDKNLSINKITQISQTLGADFCFRLTEEGNTGFWVDAFENKKLPLNKLKINDSVFNRHNDYERVEYDNAA